MIQVDLGSRRRRVIDGRSMTCRTCQYVMDPKLEKRGVEGKDEQLVVVCCRSAPPREFVWKNKELDPFCGDHKTMDGEVVPVKDKAVYKPAAVPTLPAVVVEFGKSEEQRKPLEIGTAAAIPFRKPQAAAPEDRGFEDEDEDRSPAKQATSVDLGSVSLSLRGA